MRTKTDFMTDDGNVPVVIVADSFSESSSSPSGPAFILLRTSREVLFFFLAKDREIALRNA
jgi:hypothetical protein